MNVLVRLFVYSRKRHEIAMEVLLRNLKDAAIEPFTVAHNMTLDRF